RFTLLFFFHEEHHLLPGFRFNRSVLSNLFHHLVSSRRHRDSISLSVHKIRIGSLGIYQLFDLALRQLSVPDSHVVQNPLDSSAVACLGGPDRQRLVGLVDRTRKLACLLWRRGIQVQTVALS